MKEDKADRSRDGKITSGLERPGVCQVTEGSGEQRTMKETGREVIRGPTTTFTVKG